MLALAFGVCTSVLGAIAGVLDGCDRVVEKVQNHDFETATRVGSTLHDQAQGTARGFIQRQQVSILSSTVIQL